MWPAFLNKVQEKSFLPAARIHENHKFTLRICLNIDNRKKAPANGLFKKFGGHMCNSYWINGEKSAFLNLKTPTSKHVFERNELLIECGRKNRQIFIIDQGRARLESLDNNGNFRIHYIACEGTIIGEEFVNANDLDCFYVRARTLCLVRSMTVDEFVRTLEEDPIFMKNVLKIQHIKCQILLEENHRVSFGNALSRVANLILVLVQKFGADNNGYIKFRIKFTQQDIADLLGLTRVSVANSISRLEKCNIINRSKEGLQILRPDLLSDLVQ